MKFVFFWGHTPSSPTGVDKSCLSQWYPAPFEIEGVRYPTAEHYMMAEKARLFDDGKQLKAILASGSPAAAKAAGRKVQGFNNDVWTEHREGIVERASFAKFTQNPALGEFLRRTRKKVLVEASPYDSVWGIGMSANDDRASNPLRWRGLNLLGFALMRTRAEL